MKFTRAAATAATLALTLFAAACAGDDDAGDLDTTLPAAATPTPVPAADSMSGTLAFTPVGGSALAGEVKIEEEGTGTTVEVKIRNSTDGAVHKGHIHIHTGTCAAPGSVVAPLNDVTIGSNGEGESETTVQLPMMTVMDGQHIVAYHAAGGDPGAPVVCASIPAHAM